jgi:tryptophan-rich sensory protein
MRTKTNYITIPLITLAVALSGSYFVSQGLDWYGGLRLPDGAPDGRLIAVAWTIVYFFATLAALIFWNARGRKTFSLILVLFATNAILNALWSFIFFVQHNPVAALAEMTVLNLINLMLIGLLWGYERRSSVLLLPYLLWVAYASYLTYQIILLNG